VRPARTAPWLGLVLGLALPVAAQAAPRPFVRVQGTRLMEGARPLHFLGANVGVMHGDEQHHGYQATLRAAAADGLKVVRLWALGEGETNAPAWSQRWQLWRAGPAGWLPHAPRHLDAVLAEAGRLGLRVIVVLANHWSDYGGIPQYLRWAGLPDGGRYGDLDRFFTDARTERAYQEHLRRVVGRTNALTGVRYADDPTILAWELFNESSVTPAGRAGRRAFLIRQARLVRSLAPRQLVASGVTDYGSRASRAEWLAVCRMRELAYCDGHLYPEDSLRVQSADDLRAIIDDRVQLAHHVARKPLLFGEFGFAERPAAQAWLGRSHLDWHATFLERVHHDGAVGALPWIYVPHVAAGRRFAIWSDHASSRGLRSVLRTWARTLAAGPPARTNPRIHAGRGARPMYATEVTITQPPPALAWVRATGAGGGSSWSLAVPVDGFTRARFTDVGTHAASALVHAYGSDAGFFAFTLPASPRPLARLEIQVRLSSEFPGATAPAWGASDVVVTLAGQRVARLVAPPDDGIGSSVTLSVRDPAGLRTLVRGPAVLRFEVLPGPRANGLCLYGPPGATPRAGIPGPVGPILLQGEAF
jgi:mannan endo-1,4-beta-mannosidase